MPVKVLPYNLVTVNAAVQALIDACIGNAGELYMHDFCIDAQVGSGCDNITVKDITDYTSLTRIDDSAPTPNYVYVSLYKVSPGALDLLIDDEFDMGAGGKRQYIDLKSGCYEVRVRAFFHLTGPSDDVFIEQVFPVTLDCCKEERETLKETLILKIASLGCKMRDYGYIGRNFSEFLRASYKLECILFAVNSMCECSPNCEDVRIYKNATNKVISTCNC